MTRNELIERLKDPNPSSMKALMEEAYRVKRENLGPKVFLRGLVEVSNLCSKTVTTAESGGKTGRFTATG